MLSFISKKISGLSYRLELWQEVKRLKKSGKNMPPDIRSLCFGQPTRYDDFVNIACFIHPDDKNFLIDIGANKGDFTKDFLKFFPNIANALLFEPQLNLCNLLKVDDKLLGVPKNIFQIGLGVTNESKILSYPEVGSPLAAFTKYNSLAMKAYNFNENNLIKEDVEIKRLDDFVSDIDELDYQNLIVKIDTQGFELDVIKGGLAVLKKTDLVFLECSFTSEYEGYAASFNESAKLLESCGLFPIIFQGHGKEISYYAFERDIIFVREGMLDKIYFENY